AGWRSRHTAARSGSRAIQVPAPASASPCRSRRWSSAPERLSVLHRRSLGATIALGFASLLVMLAGMIALAIREVGVAQEQRREISAVLESADEADRLALSVSRSDSALRDYMLTRTPAEKQVTQRFR